ncbi:hypothetical protein ACH5RR_021480 [Cinchona calisaya]|uniref:Uncharacterized protein n=1 Tax=Cinchona calisaya TaxID=153742 RepID=A0ABD2ZJ71_9GENT
MGLWDAEELERGSGTAGEGLRELEEKAGLWAVWMTFVKGSSNNNKGCQSCVIDGCHFMSSFGAESFMLLR